MNRISPIPWRLALLAMSGAGGGCSSTPAHRWPNVASETTRPSDVVTVDSISIDEADFRDLSPLARAIGDARVVMLGEAGHGDGATFRAKARLVRFLHEQLGFDVLAWESGTWQCDQM